VAGSRGIAQARGGNGVLPFAQRRSSNPARNEMGSSCPARSAKRVFAPGVPGIHVVFFSVGPKTWMAGTSPAMTSWKGNVDGDP
jgi:hypothetical protein